VVLFFNIKYSLKRTCEEYLFPPRDKDGNKLPEFIPHGSVKFTHTSAALIKFQEDQDLRSTRVKQMKKSMTGIKVQALNK
jgi:hypothetical protein